jgi:hypothetical protein
VLVVSFLYSYPFYRGKRYFPSNLKIEGVWGAASFLTGAISALENQASAGPFWGGPAAPVLGPFPWQTVVAAALVFGGYSVVAALKDYKDWEADLQAGVQTLYTLAQRRSWPFLRVHRLIVALAAICLALPCPLLAWAGRFPPLRGLGALRAPGRSGEQGDEYACEARIDADEHSAEPPGRFGAPGHLRHQQRQRHAPRAMGGMETGGNRRRITIAAQRRAATRAAAIWPSE